MQDCKDGKRMWEVHQKRDGEGGEGKGAFSGRATTGYETSPIDLVYVVYDIDLLDLCLFWTSAQVIVLQGDGSAPLTNDEGTIARGIAKKCVAVPLVAKGLLHLFTSEDNLDMEDIGDKYFRILSKNSFFQDVTKDDHDIITECKMHHLFHDLAKHISQSMSKDFNQTPHMAEIPTSVLLAKKCGHELHSVFVKDEVLVNALLSFKGLRVLKLYEGACFSARSDVKKQPEPVTHALTSLLKLPVKYCRSLKSVPTLLWLCIPSSTGNRGLSWDKSIDWPRILYLAPFTAYLWL
ncbi:hypothetical protein L3X38_001866 [Prunus dulcis]|uniref:Disease resistance protein winged helix domain-containing protein n=1 Tax=Prunus dulcis TaxID=3755 RepID=A0AAD4WUD4_PRUDU|nr:hypothetical protein L3X38_001866 [Prunus dulcis]